MDRFRLAAAVLLVLVSRGFEAAEPSDPPRIGEIEIVAQPVFDEGGEDRFSWAYRLGNRLHFRTREEIIRRELLFAPGDPLDPEAIAQTERNLRALVFLKDARVEIRSAEGGTVDVRVVTHDAWTTVPELRFGKVGDEIVWSAGAAERNLFGWGKWLEVSYRSNVDRDETVFLYHDPRLAGSRVAATASYAEQSDGSRGQLAVVRPWFALETPWAWGLRLEAFDQLEPLYSDGERVADLRHVRRWGDLELARRLARSGNRATRAHLAYRKHEDEVEGDLRSFGTLHIGLSTVRHEFLKLTHINRFETPEDFNLGGEASAFLGLSTRQLGGEEGTVWFFQLQGRRGVRLGRQQFLFGGATWNARHRRGALENSVASVRLDYFNKHASRCLLIVVSELLHGRNLDPEVQIRLGAENGLRGYPVRQFVGDRSFRLNIEERLFIADDVGQLVSLAAAVFFDTGHAWPEGQPMALRDFRSNVGVGLLLGRNRLASTTPGVRFDLAYALNPIAGRSRWLLTVGSRIGL